LGEYRDVDFGTAFGAGNTPSNGLHKHATLESLKRSSLLKKRPRSSWESVHGFAPGPADRYHENIMDESRLLEEISRLLEDDGDRQRKVAGIAGAIRRAGGYRWVGLYEASEEEIANLAFDGPGAPAHPVCRSPWA
jgi:hypothetical protein